MGRSSRVRRSQESRFGKGTAGVRASPRSRAGRKVQPKSAAKKLATQLATPSSPSSSESHTEIAQEIVVWTEGMSTGIDFDEKRDEGASLVTTEYVPSRIQLRRQTMLDMRNWVEMML